MSIIKAAEDFKSNNWDFQKKPFCLKTVSTLSEFLVYQPPACLLDFVLPVPTIRWASSIYNLSIINLLFNLSIYHLSSPYLSVTHCSVSLDKPDTIKKGTDKRMKQMAPHHYRTKHFISLKTRSNSVFHRVVVEGSWYI